MFAIGDLPLPTTCSNLEHFYTNCDNPDFLRIGSRLSLYSATTITGGDSDEHPTIVARGKTRLYPNISPFRPNSLINPLQRQLSNGFPTQLSPNIDDLSPNNFSQPLQTQLAFLQNQLTQLQIILPQLQAQLSPKSSQFNNLNLQQEQTNDFNIKNSLQYSPQIRKSAFNYRSFSAQSNPDDPFYNTLVSQFVPDNDSSKNAANNGFSQMLLKNNAYNNGSCSPLINNLSNALLNCTNPDFDVCVFV